MKKALLALSFGGLLMVGMSASAFAADGKCGVGKCGGDKNASSKCGGDKNSSAKCGGK